MNRLLAAFVLFPVVFASLAYGLPASLDGRFALGSFMSLLAAHTMASYFFAVLIGIPFFALGWKHRMLPWWYALAVGSAAGFVPAVLISFTFLFDQRLRFQFRLDELWGIMPLVLIGASQGLLFWVLGIWRNPAIPKRASVSL